MAVTPGSKSKLNTVKGVSAILSITDAEDCSFYQGSSCQYPC